MPLTREELRNALEAGELERVLGEFESDWLEAKRTLYRLSNDRECLEMVKDISAMANVAGGIIVLGYAAAKDEAHAVERIETLTPVVLEGFNAQRIRQIVDHWTFPPRVHLDFIVRSTAANPDEGIVAIVVSAAEPADAPILTRASLVDGRVSGSLVGLYERKHASIQAIDPQRLHAQIRAGKGFEERIATELQGIQAFLAARLGDVDEARRAVGGRRRYAHLPPDERDRRIQELVQAAECDAVSQFILVVTPEAEMDLTGLFSIRAGELGAHIESPPSLRRAGFDIDMERRSAIVHGDRRRAVAPRWGALEAHRDGTIMLVAPGGPDRLCWGRRRDPVPRINPIALIEMTYLFCWLGSQLYAGSLDNRARVRPQILMRNLNASGDMTTLAPGNAASFMGRAHAAPRRRSRSQWSCLLITNSSLRCSHTAAWPRCIEPSGSMTMRFRTPAISTASGASMPRLSGIHRLDSGGGADWSRTIAGALGALGHLADKTRESGRNCPFYTLGTFTPSNT